MIAVGANERGFETHIGSPFDLPLGNRKPLPSHKAFLVNLLSLFCTGLEEGAAPEKDIPGLLGRAIDLAYDELSDLSNGSKPRLYQPNALPELHKLLLDEGAI